ncbi:hypothetical protein, partial [Rhodococcus qingshengii]|uniref:hypothetical protein n=1 Tax=Rhodococcus qingshengii TaxID=334542 RepID=UPI0036D91197
MRPEWRIADNSLPKMKTPICVDADRGLNFSVGAEGFEPYSGNSIHAVPLSIDADHQHFYAM